VPKLLCFARKRRRPAASEPKKTSQQRKRKQAKQKSPVLMRLKMRSCARGLTVDGNRSHRREARQHEHSDPRPARIAPDPPPFLFPLLRNLGDVGSRSGPPAEPRREHVRQRRCPLARTHPGPHHPHPGLCPPTTTPAWTVTPPYPAPRRRQAVPLSSRLSLLFTVWYLFSSIGPHLPSGNYTRA